MLVRNLPSDVDKAKSAFQRRVHARYPDGIGASALADDLRGKGFHIYNDRKNGLVIAELEQHSFPCVFGWSIYWSPDEQGHARTINGQYRYDCP